MEKRRQNNYKHSVGKKSDGYICSLFDAQQKQQIIFCAYYIIAFISAAF